MAHFWKIVQTIENNKAFITAVPHQWEQNQVLLWPGHLNPTQRQHLRKNPGSTSQQTWQQYECTVRCTNIFTFVDALALEKGLSACSDTEAEDM